MTAQKQLSHGQILAENRAGYYADGGGVYLRVFRGGTKTFLVRFVHKGSRVEAILGQFPSLGLADARKLGRLKIAEMKKGAANAESHPRETRAKKGMTFRECAARFISAHGAKWSEKTIASWTQTLADYADPVIGDLLPANIKTDHVMAILEPIWLTKTGTADRTRQRIEAVLGWATTHELRDGSNPARWKGHLQNLLASPSKIHTVEHREALPFADIPEFIGKLQASSNRAAKALLFTILTAARSGEARGTTWGEIDSAAHVWIVPPHRMKAGKEHRVPLVPQTVELLTSIRPTNAVGLVFAGARKGMPLSEKAFPRLLADLGYLDLTTHGFRSTFRDWAAETTSTPNEVVEMALAHAIGNKVEAAYRRGDLFDRRRKLMDAWSEYCFSAIPHF